MTHLLLIDLPYSAPLATLVAVVPAVLRWWWGRALAPLADDPAFPERLVAHRHRAGRSFGVACALLLVLFTRTLVWSLPLLMLSCAAASFQFRRIIHRESWGFGAYLSFLTRTIVAVFGFWLLLAALPALASLGGSRDWQVALPLGVLLALWNARYPEIVRVLVRAKTIEAPALVQRFVGVAQASTAGLPHFEQVALGGGAIANAIALPSLRRSAVLFTDTLLSRLDEDELAAICGHELAHLEYYNPQRLRQLNVGNLLLIAGSVATVFVTHAIGPSWLSLSILWPFVVVAAMGWRARHRQQHETESDLRAVALTGNPEALASALTKIHAYAHLPRRVDAQLEQHASHPSLARRIKAIRSAVPGVAPAAAANASFVATDGRTQVTFGDDRLEWREGDAALHSLTYACLSELRVQAPPSGQARLLLVELGGRRWELPLAAADVARAQAVLDLVDGQLAEPATPTGSWPAVQRVLTFVAVSAAILSGQIATMIVALLATFRPSSPIVAAAGAAMIAGAGLSLREPDWMGLESQSWVPLALVCIGGFLLWTAWRSRGTQTEPKTTRIVAALGVLAGLALAFALAAGSDVVRLHQSARAMTGAVVWPIACAAALACYSSGRAWVASGTALLCGLAMATVGSIRFLDRFGSDPLLLPSQALTQVQVSGAPAAEFALPFFATGVRLSPGGVSLAAQDARRHSVRDVEAPSFEVGRLGRDFSSVKADDLTFLDDERLLTVQENDAGTEIDERLLGQLNEPVWRQQVPDVFGARLTLDRGRGRWHLLGWDAADQIVRARGVIGAEGFEITRWPSPSDRRLWQTVVAVSEHDALLVETHYDVSALQTISARTFLAFLNPGATVSRVWHVGQSSRKDLGTSRITTDCHPDVTSSDLLVCSAYDGTRTRIVALDPASGGISGVGIMNGRFAADQHSPAGWLTGWRDSTPVALRLATREILTLAERPPAFFGLTASDRWLATLTLDGASSKIQLFSLPLQ